MGDAKDQGDRALARSTLVEGDATLLMSLWAQQHMTPAELREAASAADPASAGGPRRACPRSSRTRSCSRTRSGLTMTLGAFQQAGGYAGVDGLFANPPDTTEQVLHPEKLAARERAGRRSRFPTTSPARSGDGWTRRAPGHARRVPAADLLARRGRRPRRRDDRRGRLGRRPRRAGSTGPDGANAAVLDTRWDTDADAAEFAAALGGLRREARGRGPHARRSSRPAPDRVVVISANDADTLGRIANVLGLAG